MLEDFHLGSTQAKDDCSLGDSCLLKQGSGEAEHRGFPVALSKGTERAWRTCPHGMKIEAFQRLPEARLVTFSFY